jgi:hypothetical protein
MADEVSDCPLIGVRTNVTTWFKLQRDSSSPIVATTRILRSGGNCYPPTVGPAVGPFLDRPNHVRRRPVGVTIPGKPAVRSCPGGGHHFGKPEEWLNSVPVTAARRDAGRMPMATSTTGMRFQKRTGTMMPTTIEKVIVMPVRLLPSEILHM